MLSKKLKLGDTIGIISPASPADPCKIKEGINFIQNIGFKIKKSKHLYDKLGYLAGKDKDRAKDLMDMFLDDSVNAILCVRGGYGSSRILPLINYHIIREHPKIFVGFSDITALLNSISYKCKFPTFHGPMETSKLDDTETLNSFLNTLMCGIKPYTISNPYGIDFNCDVPGIAEGKIVGGNLSLIGATMGTPYEINTKDNILFIEDVNEAPYAIDRILTELYLAHKLQKCSGFIIGQFSGCSLEEDTKNFPLYKILKDRILSLKKPTISNFMAGHIYPNITIPIGANAKIDSYKGTIRISQPVVKN